MIDLQPKVSAESLAFATVSWWKLTPVGVRIATMETATFALLQVAGGGFQSALFEIPAQTDQLEATLGILDHVYRLGRTHRAADVLRKVGVTSLLEMPPLANVFHPPEKAHG